jgi:hypothetical protein
MSLSIRRGTTFWLLAMVSSVRERNLSGTPSLTMVIAEEDHPEHIAYRIEKIGGETPGEMIAVLQLHQPRPLDAPAMNSAWENSAKSYRR